MTGVISQQHTAVSVAGADERTPQLRGDHLIACAVRLQPLACQRIDLDLIESVRTARDAHALHSDGDGVR